MMRFGVGIGCVFNVSLGSIGSVRMLPRSSGPSGDNSKSCAAKYDFFDFIVA